jgi:hypothetical protein
LCGKLSLCRIIVASGVKRDKPARPLSFGLFPLELFGPATIKLINSENVFHHVNDFVPEALAMNNFFGNGNIQPEVRRSMITLNTLDVFTMINFRQVPPSMANHVSFMALQIFALNYLP